ncbi:hypothetical protein [Parasediminibacterium sp. JCM 36343]|uniref:hypothetical protein n=1 Tax=Parasediminibacterium sp. JCM 36343 TaxID=3374279 RepID=UPI00397D9863
MDTNDITLQINLSPGDINYAQLTVPAIVKKHGDIKRRLLVVDCCRPQETKLVKPDIKFPVEVFQKKVEQIIAIAEQFKYDGLVTDIYYLKPNDPLIKHLSKKYLRGIYDCTHSGGGTANMSYWAAIELPTTRYVLHYDGDLLLYQKEGYSWVDEAMGYFADSEDIITVLPRYAAPAPAIFDAIPSYQEGTANEGHEKYWLNEFFSTRQFLLDKQRLAPFLPLMKGKILVETLLRKYGNRVYPRDPEIVLFYTLSAKHAKRLILKSGDAWILHPNQKPKEYLDMLPQMIKYVDAGICPEGQKGYPNIILDEWVGFNTKDK